MYLSRTLSRLTTCSVVHTRYVEEPTKHEIEQKHKAVAECDGYNGKLHRLKRINKEAVFPIYILLAQSVTEQGR